MRDDSVSTDIAVEKDPTCKAFLKNLNEADSFLTSQPPVPQPTVSFTQAYVPKNIIENMDLLITQDCQQEMARAKEAVMTDLEYKLSPLQTILVRFFYSEYVVCFTVCFFWSKYIFFQDHDSGLVKL